MTTNILIGGVGGQGLVLMTNIICQGAMKAGYDVKSNDVVGLSQRGGKVWGNVRFGEKIYSPNISAKQGDVLIATEPLEALRWSASLKDGGVIIANPKTMYSTPVQQEKAEYPKEEIDALKDKYKVIEIDANEEAKKLGKIQVSNVIMIGALARELEIPIKIWEETILENVPPKFKEMNISAFRVGYNG